MQNYDVRFQNESIKLIDVFSEIVSSLPTKKAVIDSTELELSYAELDLYSDQIATIINQLGIPENKRIGICIARSCETIATMLATIKLGCTYIPLATDFPNNRMHNVCQKAELSLVIANNAILEKFKNVQKIIDIDLEKNSIKSIQETLYARDEQQSQPANIIFTSGTTSSPKGIVIRQSSIVNLVKKQNYAVLTESEVMLQLSPFEFDGATFEIWGSLLNGATLVLMPPGYPVLSIISDKIETYNVSLLFITTQLFNIMVTNRIDSLDKVKQILFGGELASTKHVRQFIEKRKYNQYLANIYGPTECTVFSTFYPINSNTKILANSVIPIGKAIAGVQVTVINDQLESQKKNTQGELLISGLGISDGYLDRTVPKQTNFITMNLDGIVSTSHYKTGDQVIEDDNDNMVFLGRNDNQLKIRGYRVLPGEIELTAMKFSSVSSAALCIVEEDTHNKYLELYITLHDRSFSKEIFITFLKNELPGYMHVNRITTLETMPLKKNGKINYTQLNQQAMRNKSE